MGEQLTDPPTEAEVSELINACKCCDSLEMISRRLAYNRDRLQTAVNRLAEALVNARTSERFETVDKYNLNLAHEIIAERKMGK